MKSEMKKHDTFRNCGFKIFKIHFYGRFPAASVTAVLEFKKRGDGLSAISFIPATVTEAL